MGPRATVPTRLAEVTTDPGLYGRSFADVYDDWYGDVSDGPATVSMVASLAAGGAILELGSGTGRLAGPLADGATMVVALDASAEMNLRFAAKAQHNATIVQADMARLPLATDTFAAVFIAFNTICNLAGHDLQIECLAEVGRVLRADGHLAVEAFVPTTDDEAPDRVASLRDATAARIVMTETAPGHEPGQVAGRHIELRDEGGIRVRPWVLRGVGPDELDVMADRAGLTLVRRAADWRGTPFDDDCEAHVSVYRRVGAAVSSPIDPVAVAHREVRAGSA